MNLQRKFHRTNGTGFLVISTKTWTITFMESLKNEDSIPIAPCGFASAGRDRGLSTPIPAPTSLPAHGAGIDQQDGVVRQHRGKSGKGMIFVVELASRVNFGVGKEYG